MNSCIRLSVIIPGYNTPIEWWSRCLASVLLAIGENDEVICVDDGSKNKVSSFWKKITQGDTRFKLLTLERNVGQAEARNRAIEVALGRYVTFVDSDDEIIGDIYSKCFEGIDKTHSDIVIYGVRTVWTREKLQKDDYPQCDCSGELRADEFRSLLNGCLFEYPVNKLYSRNFLDTHRIRFKKGVCPGEDSIFNMECLLAHATWSCVRAVGYIYYRNGTSSLATYLPKFTDSLRAKADIRMRYKKEFASEKDDLSWLKISNEQDIIHANWINLWRKESPFSLAERWNYLKKNNKKTPIWFFAEFAKMLTVTFLKRHMKLGCMRKHQVLRMYPQAKKWRRL